MFNERLRNNSRTAGFCEPSKCAGAASRFFKTANDGDEFCLVELANRAEVAVPLTQNAESVDYKLMFTKAGGSTAFLDGVYLALTEMKKARKIKTRQLKADTAELEADAKSAQS